MKVKMSGRSVNVTVLALLLISAAVFAQEKSSDEKPAGTGVVEFGVRYTWGTVYGRPDLVLGPNGPAPSGNPSITPGCLGCGTAFGPLLRTSKYEEYRDLSNGFFVPKVDTTFDNFLKSRNFIILQAQKTLYRDQSYLVTFGQYGGFKLQFRYDQIPHVYSNTTRTLYTKTATSDGRLAAVLA